jgi:hypothetical protein
MRQDPTGDVFVYAVIGSPHFSQKRNMFHDFSSDMVWQTLAANDLPAAVGRSY